MKSCHYYNLFSIAILLALFVLAGTAGAVKIKPHIDTDRPFIRADEEETVYVLVRFEIPELEIRPQDRPNLNLGLVIDRSGSMEDRGKMNFAKQSANMVVDKLSRHDRLAVVEYDDRISVLWPSSPVESKRMIKSKISELYPRGSTNLTGGMLEGVDQVLDSYLRRGINRVVLLSDGLANQGIMQPQQIKRLVKEARRKGITISTMGLGLDYNEDLMQMIAEHAGGRYYFIENPRQMHAIFEEELGTMFANVCRNMKAKLRMSSRVRDYEILGYMHDGDSRIRNIDIGDLYAGEEISLVVKMTVDPQMAGQVRLGDIEFEYTDAKGNSNRIDNYTIEVEASVDLAKVEDSRDKDVSVEVTLVEADAFHEEQIRLYEAGDVKKAQENLAVLNQSLQSSNALFKDISLAAKIEALDMEVDEMKEAEASSDGMSGYLKSNKARFYQAQKGKRSTYLMKPGASGFDVERLQQVLTDKGFYTGPIDGKYDDDVKDAVKKLQKVNNIDTDGVAGPKTLKAAGIY